MVQEKAADSFVTHRSRVEMSEAVYHTVPHEDHRKHKHQPPDGKTEAVAVFHSVSFVHLSFLFLISILISREEKKKDRKHRHTLDDK